MDQLSRQAQQAFSIQNFESPNPYARPQWSSFYRGPGLPVSYTGQIDPPERVDIQLIFDSIRQIIETIPGERLMLPSFGSRIFELIGEPLAPVFEYRVKQFLTDSLRMWEPRAQITNVQFVYDYPNHAVHITYYMNVTRLGISAQSTFKVPIP